MIDALHGNKLKWFHSFAWADGIKPMANQLVEADAIFKHGVEGKSVLDLGAWDGWYSFEAERRGARDVLATDHYCWDSGLGWGNKDGFRFAHKQLESNVRSQEIDILDVSQDSIGGAFDVTLLLGVLYHVRDMMTVIERAASVTHSHLIVETATAPGATESARFWPEGFNNDKSNFWTPTVSCVTGMMRWAGFPRCEVIETPMGHQGDDITRHIIHGFRI